MKKSSFAVVAALFAASALSSTAPILDGGGIRIEFDSEDNGFDCLSIYSMAGGTQAQFGDGMPDDRPGLWNLRFWRDGNPLNTVWLSNHDPSNRSAEISDGALRLLWEGLSLGDEAFVVDVMATVELTGDGASAEWRIYVSNRNERWGLAEVEYPIMRHVVASNTASSLLPQGTMGGRLYERYNGGDLLLYPHGTIAPVQTLAFMQDSAGLQFTALDGKAQRKTFDTRGLDMRISYKCPDEGVPGAANAPDYAIETAAFAGNWWVAAKRYRAWATRQVWASKGPLRTRTDFSRRIGDVGYWVNSSGAMKDAESTTNLMAQMQAALPGIPLALHWANWFHSPFDIGYPEMFPARDGVRESAEWPMVRITRTNAATETSWRGCARRQRSGGGAWPKTPDG